MGRYLFADSELAARRLALLHDIFAPSSQSFLEACAPRPRASQRRSVAVDVGCGSGCTTEAVRRTVRPDVVIGFDLSAAFVGLAQAAYPRCQFARADVAVSLPVRSTDLVYARYVLTHMTDPLTTLRAWLETLAPSARVLVEENVDLGSTDEAIAEYIETAAQVLHANGQDLYLGRTLEGWIPPAGVRVIAARRTKVVAGRARTAEMFSMNLPAWRDRATSLRSRSDLDRLARQLQEEAASEREGPPTTWTLLQLALERVSDAP